MCVIYRYDGFLTSLNLFMKKISLLIVAILLPRTALALDYSDAGFRYKDASSFSTAESAGISLLTNAGVVQGNPSGRFVPKRQLNRAEFTKIAMLLAAQVDAGSLSSAPAQNCFPDVRSADWFAPYVCSAKAGGIVAGNPDGLFHPERSVNYAEALKILANVFRYDIPAAAPGEAWFLRYVDAADAHKTAFLYEDDPSGGFGRFLTRGEMARLGAAFYAESQGELDQYLAAEAGRPLSSSSVHSSSSSVSTSSSPSTSSSSPMSSVSSVSSVSSSVSSVSAARSHFLMLGQRSLPVASVDFFANLEPMKLSAATVKLRNKVDSISAMYLVDSTGTQVGQLSLDADDADKLTWKGSFGTANYEIPKSGTRTFAIEVKLYDKDRGGYSGEMLEVTQWTMSFQGVWTSSAVAPPPTDFEFPKHSTVQGAITAVKNALPDQDPLPVGTNQIVAAFEFAGTSLSPAKNKLEELSFQVGKTDNVTVTNWQLGAPDAPDRVTCIVSGSTVSCPGITDGIGIFQDGKRTIRLYGDVALAANAQNPSLQVTINKAGSVGDPGSILWTDGYGHFNWVELDAPVARGTVWK